MMPVVFTLAFRRRPQVRAGSLKEARRRHKIRLASCFAPMLSVLAKLERRSPPSASPSPARPRPPSSPPTASVPPRVGCEMPLRDKKHICGECLTLGPFMNCTRPGDMPQCNAEDTWIACENCDRILCSMHFQACYCFRRLQEAGDRMTLNYPEPRATANIYAPGSSAKAEDA